jgi:predicted DNA-binding transcriptional regulator AlpA
MTRDSQIDKQGSRQLMDHRDLNSRLLTARDVSRITGLSVETLAQWRSQKRGIPFLKISRNCVRYRQCDLDGWLSERIVRTHDGRAGREGGF